MSPSGGVDSTPSPREGGSGQNLPPPSVVSFNYHYSKYDYNSKSFKAALNFKEVVNLIKHHSNMFLWLRH